MESKYYTPSIEEFHVGFEYEQLEASDTANGPELELSWVKKQVYHGFGCFDEDRWALEENEIRVKYLDKQDIEELGFKLMWSEYNELSLVKNNTLIQLRESNYMEIFNNNIQDKFKSVLFRGKIKNKSELKQLLEMLNISYED